MSTDNWLGKASGAAVLICLACVVSACNPTAGSLQPPGQSVSTTFDQIRHNLEPLTKRFPAIGNPNSATWMSGTLGAQSDSRASVPGPSVYWIEAIINLEPTTADSLRSKYTPTATDAVPNLNEVLRPDVPAGPFLTSRALNTALSNNDWRSTAYLNSGSNTLVMRSVDD